MPITANFQADFTSFSTAVTAATTKLITFEDEAKKVAGSLSAMEKSISGVPIMQAATVAAEAVERLGGASKLTYSELQRLGGTAQEAVAKMQALGQNVPTGIQNLADRARGASEEMLRLASATTQTQTSTLNWSSALSTATGVLGAFGVTASIGQLVQWGRALVDGAKALVDYAGGLSDMSAKTDMSVENLQRLGIAGAASGVKLEDFTAASYKLGLALQGGEGSVVRAVDKLKLNYQQLAAMNVDQQFNTVTKALENVSSTQERNRLGAELMSKTYGTIAPAIVKGFNDIAAAADVSSKQQLDAIDALGDAWDGFVARRKAQAASMAGATILGAKAFTDLSLAEKLEVVSSSNLFEVWERLMKLGDARAKQVDIELPKDEKRTIQTKAQQDAAAKFADAMEEMNSVGKGWAGTLDTIDGNVVEAIKYYLAAGVAQNKLAIAYELTVPQVNAVAESIKALTKADQEMAKHQAEADAIRMNSFSNQIKAVESLAAANAKAYGTEEQIAALKRLDAAELAITKSIYENVTSEKDRMKLIEQYNAKHAEINAQIIGLENKRKDVVNAAVVSELDALKRREAAYAPVATAQQTAYRNMEIALDKLHLEQQKGIKITESEEDIYRKYREANLAAAQADDALRDAEGRKNAEVAKVPGVMAAAEAATKSYAAANQSSGSTGGQFQAPSFGGYLDPVQSFKLPSYAEGGVGNFGAGTLALLHGLEAIVPLDKMPTPPSNASDLRNYTALFRQQQAQLESMGLNMMAAAPATNTSDVRNYTVLLRQYEDLMKTMNPGQAMAPAGTVETLALQNKKLVQQFYAEEEERRRTAETGGGPTITVNVTQPLGTPSQIADVVGKAVMQSLRNQGVRFPSGA